MRQRPCAHVPTLALLRRWARKPHPFCHQIAEINNVASLGPLVAALGPGCFANPRSLTRACSCVTYLVRRLLSSRAHSERYGLPGFTTDAHVTEANAYVGRFRHVPRGPAAVHIGCSRPLVTTRHNGRETTRCGCVVIAESRWADRESHQPTGHDADRRRGTTLLNRGNRFQ